MFFDYNNYVGHRFLFMVVQGRAVDEMSKQKNPPLVTLC